MLVSVGSGMALANFTIAGTSQFYMPQSAESSAPGTDYVADSQANSGPLEWLPSYASVSERSDDAIARAQGDGTSYD